MDKNMKNYMKVQTRQDYSISNIGNEYYQLKKTIYDLDKKNKKEDFNIDQKIKRELSHENKRMKVWGGRTIPA